MPKFKVGDKVRVTNCHSYFNNQIGTVDEVKFESSWKEPIYNVYFLGENGNLYWFDQDELVSEFNGVATEVQPTDTGSAATSKHYNAQVIQPIEVMQSVLTHEEFLGFLKGNILKYSARAGTKNGESSEKDLNKAKQYSLWKRLAEAGKTIDPRKDVV